MEISSVFCNLFAFPPALIPYRFYFRSQRPGFASSGGYHRPSGCSRARTYAGAPQCDRGVLLSFANSRWGIICANLIGSQTHLTRAFCICAVVGYENVIKPTLTGQLRICRHILMGEMFTQAPFCLFVTFLLKLLLMRNLRRPFLYPFGRSFDVWGRISPHAWPPA